MAAYSEMYLNQIKTVTKFVFHMFMRSEYDFNACVCDYMSNSEIRARMDVGNWSALNKGSKQIYNSVNFDILPKNDNAYMDGILSDWLALIYVHFQWKYNISSRQIVEILPPDRLRSLYHPLNETSINNACEKLHHKFFE